MAAPFWLNAALRSLVWLGATVLLAFLKKPDGANFAAVRAGDGGWLGIGLLVAGLALHFWSNVSLYSLYRCLICFWMYSMDSIPTDLLEL
jgi:hypothetical protein